MTGWMSILFSLMRKKKQKKTLSLKNWKLYNISLLDYCISRIPFVDIWRRGSTPLKCFKKRNASLSKEIARLQETEEKLLRKRESGDQANQAALDIIPTTQHILDNYDALTTEEKNRLWKLVLRKVTAYRTPDGKLSVHIYPKLPKAI